MTGIPASSPLTGGGTSGAVTVGIQDALTTQKGAVQLSDSTSTTSSILAATPTAVKSAYDLAAAAIPKSTSTTAISATSGTTKTSTTRLQFCIFSTSITVYKQFDKLRSSSKFNECNGFSCKNECFYK
jgi:phage-related tail fiber protein